MPSSTEPTQIAPIRDAPIRIAMWSGPRNLSTAMMRSFENRADCAVWDEPFFAAYLVTSGVDHPYREESIAVGIQDPGAVRDACVGEVPNRAPIHYQKHMTHHMLEDFPLNWTGQVRNAFLIRHPARVVASYEVKRSQPTEDDLGFVRQSDLFAFITQSQGAEPTIVDADDVCSHPQQMIPKLCAALDIPFSESMLTWPAGPRESDGAWAPHWYNAVEKSTRFVPPKPMPEVAAQHRDIVDAAMPLYEALREKRIKP